jgi:hypothetical protein
VKKGNLLIVIFVLLLTAALLVIYALSFQRVRLEPDSSGRVIYSCNGISFDKPLSGAQMAQVRQIIDGKKMAPQGITGVPSCPFSENIALVLGERRFYLACDTCGILQDGETKRYFKISDAERRTLEEIFDAYGGRFPCM